MCSLRNLPQVSTALYCDRAGISIEDFKCGTNSQHCEIPPDRLVNGCFVELDASTRPCSWTTLTAFLRVWMGSRFPDGTNPAKLRYHVHKILAARRKISRSTGPDKATKLQLLMEEPFTIPPNLTPVPTSSMLHSITTTIGNTTATVNVRPDIPTSSTLTSAQPYSTTTTERTSIITRPADIIYSSTPSARVGLVFSLGQRGIPVTQTSTTTHAVPVQQATAVACARPSVSPIPQRTENLFDGQCVTNSRQSAAFASCATMTQTVTEPSDRALQYKTKLHNAKRRERRKTTTIHTQKRTINALKKQLNHLAVLKQEKRCLEMKLRRKQKHIASAPLKANKTSQCRIPCTQCARYEQSLDRALDESVVSKPRTVDLKKGCRYSDNVVRCVLKLLDHGVGYSHVGPVIEAALQIVNVTPKETPSRSTVENIAEIKMPLTHLNLATSTSTLQDGTLYTDETKKHGQQYETYIITDSQQHPKLLGLREIKDKSAATILETLQTILTDIDDIMNSEQKDAGKHILASIKNTMSDRAATEKSFQALLHDYRKEILPQVIPNWDTLSTSSREKLGEIHNFYCGLHLLVNAADKCAASLKQFEAKHTDTASGEESKTVNLIRTACKAFSRGGDDKSGCYSASSTYLAGRGIKTRLTNFRGNRFNLLFHNAAVLYHQSEHLQSFLQDCWGTPNLLLQAVLKGLTSDICMAGCRALGLLDKLLTKPLWQVIESQGSILAMNSVYASLMDNLQTCDTQTILNGNAKLIPGIEIPTDDVVLHSLTTPNANDVLTQAILEVVIKDLTDLFTHLLKDQLPDGVNANKTPSSQPECASALKHNKLPETIFARLDYLQHQKPAAQTYSLESTILYSFNKVGEWLDSMTPEDRADTLTNASVLRKTSMRTFKQRQDILKRQKMEALKQKELELQRRRQKALARKTSQTNDIVIHGLWQTPADVETKLKTYRSVSAKTEALKIQLNFRKNVLCQSVMDKSLFSFTVNRKKLTVTQLTKNLMTVIEQAGEMQLNSTAHHLVNKHVRHQFLEDDMLIPYIGKVVSQVPGFPKWFNIVYECEPDTVYTYQLEDDLEAGDLTVLSEDQWATN